MENRGEAREFPGIGSSPVPWTRERIARPLVALAIVEAFYVLSCWVGLADFPFWHGLLILNGVMAALGVGLAHWLRRRRGWVARTSSDGLQVATDSGTRFWTWAQIEGIYLDQVDHYRRSILRPLGRGHYMGTTHGYILRMKDGEAIRFDDRTRDVEELFQIVVRQGLPGLVDEAGRILNSGGTLDFASIEVDGRGLVKSRGGSLPMDQVGHVSVDEGFLVIHQKRTGAKWATLPIAGTKNFHLLLHLLQPL